MRKIIAILILTLSLYPCIADEAWVKFEYIPNKGNLQAAYTAVPTYNSFNNILAVDLGFKKEFFRKILFIQGFTNIYTTLPGKDRKVIGGFDPFFAIFNIQGGLQYKGFTLSYEHQCSHPIDIYNYSDKGIILTQEPIFNVNEWYNKIMLEYRIKL